MIPSVLAPSVWWSLQCLISTLTQGSHGGHFFRLTFSLRCGEGKTLQTNNTGMCSQCLSHTEPAPCSQCMCPPCSHCSSSRLLCWEPSEAGPGLHVPPRSKPLRFRHSGSPQRRRLSWACVLCPSRVRAAQVMRCLASAVAVTYRLPAARLSGCTTSAPSQADFDCPEPQEVLVSREARLQFCR